MRYRQLYHESLADPVGFWKKQSKSLHWFKDPEDYLYTDEEGLYRWFRGGWMNTSYLCADYHVEQGRGAQVALVFDSPVTGVLQRYTYAQLQQEVAKTAGMLRDLGVGKGDRVILYMPMIPQAVFAMLACARLGAVHSVVFGGFAPHELALRLDDAQPKVLLTASGGMEFDKPIPYQPIVERALAEAQHRPEHVVVWQRDFVPAELYPGRYENWQTLVARAAPASFVLVEATDPLYILYTSGTTGKPKGIIRDNGGHAVALRFSMEYIYGAGPGDVFWAASDIGWVVGHSYIVYAPLLTGCTTVLYEGKPVRTPDAGAWWRVIQEHRVNVLFTAPTGIRAVKKEDLEGLLKAPYDTSSLKYLFLAGERCDVATLEWAAKLLKVPVIDHWWQTESGWPMLATMAGTELSPVKPGSAGRPVCGYDIRVVDDKGHEVAPGVEGAVVIRLPLPPGTLPNLWQNTTRFRQGYLEAFPGNYFTGDGGYRDEDGYLYITGRIDDIINVAGHRLSTAEMEEAVSGHAAVAECAVVGIHDELKGQIPLGLVVLKGGVQLSAAALEAELVARVRDLVGPVAAFKRALVVQRLPKTRSGKILRKIIRALADGESFTMPSTIEDASVLEELKQVFAVQLQPAKA
jgi:acyl-coenzyme A synthetase/AMP-(fatty) acid ligase